MRHFWLEAESEDGSVEALERFGGGEDRRADG